MWEIASELNVTEDTVTITEDVTVLTLSALKRLRFSVHRRDLLNQACTLTGSAVAHGGDPQDRAASPRRVEAATS
ncbi:MAG: hypothetical protein QNJ63_01270 [Calothrix sp. MO_192.B10]|nr:hypothetical protein [Calothrix sp. MO_192.B10]